jgi:hypothetical protein
LFTAIDEVGFEYKSARFDNAVKAAISEKTGLRAKPRVRRDHPGRMNPKTVNKSASLRLKVTSGY